MIRLVEILPGKIDRICCKIHVIDLNELPKATIEAGQDMSFEALSYTWDVQTSCEYIWCNDKVLPVTQNLYAALQRLRKSSTSSLYWIDAVCINQLNISERNHQVALMRVIYHRAVHVIAWIGPDDQFTQKAFCLVETIVAKTISSDGSFKADAGTIWNHHAMERIGLPRFPSSEWEALARLFEKPYFRRLWVVQELVVSSEATTWCGPFSVRWAHIEYVAKLILSSGWLRALQEVYGVKVRPSFIQTIGNCKIHFHETQGGPGMGLANLLCSTRRFEATDPRDKIIALIGLTKDARKYEATITDYSKPITDLYKDTTGQLITADQSLLLLSSVEDSSYRHIHELPSWVPDYSVWQRSSILGFPLRHSKYSAGGRTPASVRWTPGSRSLMVDGICQDEIEAVSTNSLENSAIAQTFLLQCLVLAGPLLSKGSISIDAVWRTLIGNTGGDTYPAPEKYRLHFRSYLSRLSARNQAYLKTLASNEDVHALLTMETKDLKAANSQYYQASIAYTAPYRKFFTTTRGTIGLGPQSIRPGDSICIFRGGLVPFVLRKDGTRHRLVGEAYVHGVMDGQAIWRNTTFEEFHIW
ncbi:hypothetical protein MMC17_007084 [Xylographa soralifera]|nr:hypothetical protein [Xylographa soralifera]